ncbi:hypothetical protein LC593_10930 [Nostoc sp. CHAB 5844]|nr:hypothetical protein [Nostoc sp. CHAB 5844]
MIANQVNEFEIIQDIRHSGGGICPGDARLVAEVINQWKCGPAAVIYYLHPFDIDVEDFRTKVKPLAEAAIHDALICGYQVFYVNLIGGWEAYPELEEPEEPKGYWWMRILYERSTLQVSILTPTYRAYRNQVWEVAA